MPSGPKLRDIYTNTEHDYSIGTDEDSGEWMMEVVITLIAWYSMFFRLSDEEVRRFQKQQDSLTDLSHEFARDKGVATHRGRLVFSEGAAHDGGFGSR